MNEERYILAELKRWLVQNERGAVRTELMYPREVLCKIAEIEADAVLGELTEKSLPWAESEEE